MDHDKYTELLPWHAAIEQFNYDRAVDWAIEMMVKGVETENILILSSFVKPVGRLEIQPYIYGALKDLGLEEKYEKPTVISSLHYHAAMILDNYELRENLERLRHFRWLTDYDDYGIEAFFSLYHAWSGLEQEGWNHYYEGATLQNIESIVKREAKDWIDQYIHGIKKEKPIDKKSSKTIELGEELQSVSIWQKIKNFLFQ